MGYIYTICCSLGDPRSNCYLYMLMMLVHTLQKSGTFQPAKDKFFVMADDATGAVINKIGLLNCVEVIPVDKPKDVLDMMKYKYLFPKYIDCSKQTVLYLDVDFLSIKPLRLEGQIPEDAFAVVPEGPANHSNYCPPYSRLQTQFGATAGIFAYHYGPTVQKVFSYILNRIANDPERFYTLDQPHFNVGYPNAKFVVIPPAAISFNCQGDLSKAVLINLAGEPGDGPFHFLKMLEVFLRLRSQ